MGKLYAEISMDVEAGAFYGLSLLAAEPPDDTSLRPERKQSRCWSRCSNSSPIIPAWRTTSFTPAISRSWAQGAGAARAYAGIASSSAHAVHMPSHIFARLGLWQEDIQANLKSVALSGTVGVQCTWAGTSCMPCTFCFMPTLQTGQDEAARQVLEQSKQIIAAAPKNDDDTGMLRVLRLCCGAFPCALRPGDAHWKEPMALQPAANASPDMQRITWWARTIASARMGDVEATRRQGARSSTKRRTPSARPKTPTFLMARILARRGSRLAGVCRETE